MRDAIVGDDVFGEDPTVLELQESVAEILGKEAALFVPTGTMGNQIALRSHCGPGDEVLVDRSSHIFNYESGAAGALAGVQLHPIGGSGDFPTAAQFASAIRHGYYWETPTRLLCLENTLNKEGGRILPQNLVADIASVAADRGLRLHLDGARLWNASVATGQPPATLAEPFDSVNVCLSKGLGAPIGSLIAGSRDFIQTAHRFRKMYGGGMRQVGVVAAAGLYAVRHNLERLAEDHDNARILAEGLEPIKGIDATPERAETNIVMFDVPQGRALELVDAFGAEGVRVVPFGPSTIRATTHKDVSRDEIQRAVSSIQSVMTRLA